MLTTIPFDGFYGSSISDGLDYALEQYVECDHPDYTSDIFDVYFNVVDWGKVRIHLATRYVEEVVSILEDEHDIHITLEFESLQSPREYNFTTDRIFATISEEDVVTLYSTVKNDDLNRSIKERFTSRSGFISHYSNDIDDWISNPLNKWDHNEVGTLLEAIISSSDVDSIMERLNMSGAFDAALWAGIDETKLGVELSYLKEPCLKEPCPYGTHYEFPSACVSNDEYVAKFSELNHLKGE